MADLVFPFLFFFVPLPCLLHLSHGTIGRMLLSFSFPGCTTTAAGKKSVCFFFFWEGLMHWVDFFFASCFPISSSSLGIGRASQGGSPQGKKGRGKSSFGRLGIGTLYHHRLFVFAFLFWDWVFCMSTLVEKASVSIVSVYFVSIELKFARTVLDLHPCVRLSRCEQAALVGVDPFGAVAQESCLILPHPPIRMTSQRSRPLVMWAPFLSTLSSS